MTNRLIWSLSILTIALIPLQSRADGATAISEAPMNTAAVVNTSMAGAVPTTTATATTTAVDPTGLSTNQLIIPQVVIPNTDDSHSQSSSGITALLTFLGAVGSTPGGLGAGIGTTTTSTGATTTAASPAAIYGTQDTTAAPTGTNSTGGFLSALFGLFTQPSSTGNSSTSAGSLTTASAGNSQPIKVNPNGQKCSRSQTEPSIVYGPGTGMGCGDVLVDCGSHRITFSNVPISAGDQVIDCGKGNSTKNGIGKVGGHHSGKVVKDGVDIRIPGMGDTPGAGGKVFHTRWWNGCMPTGQNVSNGCIHVDANTLTLLKQCKGSTIRIINASGGGSNPPASNGYSSGYSGTVR